MHLRRAEIADSQRLKEYFRNSPLEGPIRLNNHRTGSFFDKYKLYSKDYVTYFLEDDEEQIHGLASLIFAPGYINGNEGIIGYATDLRISNSRKAILSWSQHFLPILEKERAERNCRYVFSVVSRSQKMAQNAFLRPRSARRQLPRYHLYRKFNLVGIHGKWPWSPPPLKGLIQRSATQEDMPALHQFLIKERQGLRFPSYSQPKEIENQIYSWIGMHLPDLKIIEDSQKQIVGSYALWNPTAVEEWIPEAYNGLSLTLQQVLKFFKWLRWTRPLTPPGSPLKFKYITFLQASNPDVFESILRMMWDSTERDEFLIYPHFEGDLTHSPPKSFLSSEWKFGLFCLQAPSDPFPDFFYQSFAETPPLWDLSFM